MDLYFTKKVVSKELESVLDEVFGTSFPHSQRPVQGVMFKRDFKKMVKEREGNLAQYMKGKVIWVGSYMLLPKRLVDKLLDHYHNETHAIRHLRHMCCLSWSKNENVCISATNATKLQEKLTSMIQLLSKSIRRADQIGIMGWNTEPEYQRPSFRLSDRCLKCVLNLGCSKLSLSGINISRHQAFLLGSGVSGSLRLHDIFLTTEITYALVPALFANPRLKQLALEQVIMPFFCSHLFQTQMKLSSLSLDHHTMTFMAEKFCINVEELSIPNSLLSPDILDNILLQPKIKFLSLEGCQLFERPQGLELKGLESLVRVELPGTPDNCFLGSQADWNHMIRITQEHPTMRDCSIEVFNTNDDIIKIREKVGWAASAIRQGHFDKMMYPRHSLAHLHVLSPVIVALIRNQMESFQGVSVAILPHLLACWKPRQNHRLSAVTNLSSRFALIRTVLPGPLETYRKSRLSALVKYRRKKSDLVVRPLKRKRLLVSNLLQFCHHFVHGTHTTTTTRPSTTQRSLECSC